MKLPINFEAKLDTVLRALRAGNFFADNVSVDTIKGVGANTTEVERDVIAATLNYGIIGGGNILSSTENVEVFIDSDNTNPTTPYENWFRVIRGQQTTPITDPVRELFTVAFKSNAPGIGSTCIVGPRATTITGAGEYPALFSLGAVHDGVTAQQLFTVWCRGAVSGTSIISTHATNFNVYDGALNFQAVDRFTFKGASGRVRGGFHGLGDRAQFFIGQAPDLGAQDAITWERTATTTDNAWRILDANTTTEQSLFFCGSYPNPASDARIRVCVGGVPGAGNLSPDNILLDTVTYNAQFMIVTPQVNQNRMGLWVYHRGTSVPTGTHLNNLHSSLDLQTASDSIRLFSVSGGWGGLHKNAFSVRADASCDSPGGFFTAPADLAEYFKCDVKFEPGTVLVMDPVTSTLAASSSVAAVNVIGIVSTKPGFGLNRDIELASKDNTKIPIGLSGTVPTKVSTSNGSIEVMDLLVSDLEGRACKAPSSPIPGTVVGKALEALEQSGEEKVTGVIDMFIWRC